MTTKYRVQKDGKQYVYEYERSRFGNNSSEYNKEYYAARGSELRKKAKLKHLIDRLDQINESLMRQRSKVANNGKAQGKQA